MSSATIPRRKCALPWFQSEISEWQKTTIFMARVGPSGESALCQHRFHLRGPEIVGVLGEDAPARRRADLPGPLAVEIGDEGCHLGSVRGDQHLAAGLEEQLDAAPGV